MSDDFMSIAIAYRGTDYKITHIYVSVKIRPFRPKDVI